jgi:SAM-dependent methyltransferase
LSGLKPSARILDVACGAGYGSYMLSQALPNAQIVGGDYDHRAVEHAAKTYRASNLTYTHADMVTWRDENEPLGKFDAVVSFDTIEHLLHREISLLRISENLSEDGCLLLSTPCGHSVSRLNPGWEHHKIEYCFTDLYKLLVRFFGTVIYPQHPEFPGREVWDEINAGQIRYLNRMNPLICKSPISANVTVPIEAQLKPPAEHSPATAASG